MPPIFRYKLPKAGSKTALGVSVDTDRLSYVELTATSRSIVVSRFGDAHFDPTQPHAKEKAVAALAHKVKSKQVEIAISDSDASFFELDIRERDPFLVKKLAEAEVKRAMGEGHGPVLIQTEPLFTDRSITKVAVAVIAAEKIKGTAALFKKSGFTPLRIALSSEAAALALPKEAASLLVTLGKRETHIAILSKGSLVLETTIPGGVEALISLIADGFGGEPKEIEEALFFQGVELLPSDPILPLIRPYLRKVRDEIEKLFLYWHIDCKKERECRLRTLYLFGLGAAIPGLASYFGDALSLPVVVPEPLSPLPRVEGSVPEMTKTEALERMPALALALSHFLSD